MLKEKRRGFLRSKYVKRFAFTLNVYFHVTKIRQRCKSAPYNNSKH